MRLVGRFTRRARGRCQQGMFRRRRPLPSAFYGEVDEIGKALEAARAPDPRRAVCGGGENPLTYRSLVRAAMRLGVGPNGPALSAQRDGSDRSVDVPPASVQSLSEPTPEAIGTRASAGLKAIAVRCRASSGVVRGRLIPVVRS